MSTAFRHSANKSKNKIGTGGTGYVNTQVSADSFVQGESQGLMQVVPGTFKAYASPGEVIMPSNLMNQMHKNLEKALKDMGITFASMGSGISAQMGVIDEYCNDLNKLVNPEPEHIPDQPSSLPARRFNHGPAARKRNTPHRERKAGTRFGGNG